LSAVDPGNVYCLRGAAIEKAGASIFYLLPYSPELNPIGQVFAKLKT